MVPVDCYTATKLLVFFGVGAQPGKASWSNATYGNSSIYLVQDSIEHPQRGIPDEVSNDTICKSIFCCYIHVYIESIMMQYNCTKYFLNDDRYHNDI